MILFLLFLKPFGWSEKVLESTEKTKVFQIYQVNMIQAFLRQVCMFPAVCISIRTVLLTRFEPNANSVRILMVKIQILSQFEPFLMDLKSSGQPWNVQWSRSSKKWTFKNNFFLCMFRFKHDFTVFIFCTWIYKIHVC